MEPWNGVIVEGIASESQYTPGKHGRLNAFNDAIIENSIIAVKLINGGVFSGNGTIIRNNGTGIEYNPYSNFWPLSVPSGWLGQPRDYFGGIADCRFLANNDYKKAMTLNAFVQMEGVRGIKLNGCSFINDRSIKNPTGNNSYGYGIKATDSRFGVFPRGVGNSFPPSSYDYSDFKGLGYGIYIATAQAPDDNGTPTLPNDDFVNMPYTVQQASFTECIYGIHNRFISQGTIVGNTFKLGKLPPASQFSNDPYTNDQFGVFMENGANGFELQENQFIKEQGNVPNTFGTYSQNLGWFNNNIRRNTYIGVKYGNLADEDNAVISNPPRGLHYLCNENSTERYDFYVFSGADIRRVQGVEAIQNGAAIVNSAGNHFTKSNPPFGDFYNNGPFLWYYYDGLDEKPLYFNTNHQDVTASNCESNYCLPPCRSNNEIRGLKSLYLSEYTQYKIAVSAMSNALNNGNQVLADTKSTEAAAYKLSLDNISNTVAMHLAYDTITHNLDSVRVWWRKMDSPISEMVVAHDYLVHGNNTNAFDVIDAITTKFALTQDELIDIADFRSIMHVMQGEAARTLSHNKIEQLLNFANNGKGISAAWAKNILTVKGYHFPPNYKQPEDSQERNAGDLERSLTNNDTKYLITPNPAKDFVQFVQQKQAYLDAQIQIVISDALGHIVWRGDNILNQENIVWNTTATTSGMYFYSILDQNGVVQAGRILIVK